MIICELTISDRLNKVIVGVNKGSKATCNELPPKADRHICPTLIPAHHKTNFRPGPKVDTKARLYCAASERNFSHYRILQHLL